MSDFPLARPTGLRRLVSLDSLPVSREIVVFLFVGGLGYVVDVAVFNALLSVAPFDAWDPTVARVASTLVAMVVTYVGNRQLTWRGSSRQARHREVGIFVLFNVVGLLFSVAALWISHDLLGMTSRLDDNVSANGIGLALGTAFRFWSYRRFVFA